MEGIAWILVSLIFIAGLVSYLQLFYQLGLAELQPDLFVTQGKTRRSPTTGLPDDEHRGRRKQVTWLHMHKFGGTFMTRMAGLQGEVFPPGNINANWMPDFCSTPRGQRVLCPERTGFGTPSSDISWSAMERELDQEDFCNDALVGTMLREPLGALESVLSHDRFDRAAILKTLRECSEKAPAEHFEYQPSMNAPRCLPAWDTYQHFDNFATRTLGGGYSEAPCSITPSHLEAAKSQLRRMDVLTILEELNDHLPQLQDIFHWNTTLVQTWKKVNKKTGEHEPKSEKAFTVEDMKFLKQANALDVELYAFALSLAQNMTMKARDNIVRRGGDLLLAERPVEPVGKMQALRESVAARMKLRGRPAVAYIAEANL